MCVCYVFGSYKKIVIVWWICLYLLLNNKNKVELWVCNFNSLINGYIDNVSVVYYKFMVFVGEIIFCILLFFILSYDIVNDIDRMFMLNVFLLLGILYDLFYNIDILKRLLFEY